MTLDLRRLRSELSEAFKIVKRMQLTDKEKLFEIGNPVFGVSVQIVQTRVNFSTRKYFNSHGVINAMNS